MVDYGKNEKLKSEVSSQNASDKPRATSDGYVPGVVCPDCFGHLLCPTIVRQQKDRYGREIRTYFGWCFKCSMGFEVIQYAHENKWYIHKFQPYKLVGQQLHCMPTGSWTVLNDLPEPAAVITGPGGQYDKPFNPELIKVLDSLRKAMSSVGELLKHIKSEMSS